MTEEEIEKIVYELDQLSDHMGIYPQGTYGAGGKFTPRTERQDGWNECVMKYSEQICKIMEMAKYEYSRPEKIFAASNGYFDRFDDGKGNISWHINVSDTWYWASSDAEEIKPEDYAYVANLFQQFGNVGLLYYVFKKRGHMPQIEKNKLLLETCLPELEKRFDKTIKRNENSN